jgi:hypothetical protein
MQIRRRTPNTISSAWLVRVLAVRQDIPRCTRCEARMFVASQDGLCPVCRSADHEREQAIHGIVEDQLGAASDWS